jgi:hypothetical protein
MEPPTSTPLSTGTTRFLTHRSSHLNLLQMGGAFSIVAFHIEIPFSGVGWIAVELFFVIAGINMAAARGWREDWPNWPRSLTAYTLFTASPWQLASMGGGG